ncbi:MAG: hypothetical protein U9Q37_06400 [Euryarchaeota archaeon]|nr:hypothetical protein [Euryarchaeota archaeon]
MWSRRTLAIGIVLLVALAVSARPAVVTALKEAAPVATTPVIATSTDETAASATGAGNRGGEK